MCNITRSTDNHTVSFGASVTSFVSIKLMTFYVITLINDLY